MNTGFSIKKQESVEESCKHASQTSAIIVSSHFEWRSVRAIVRHVGFIFQFLVFLSNP